MRRTLILVEGQTEEGFVNDTLSPWLSGMGMSLVPTLLKTKRVKGGTAFKGGVTSYAKFKADLLPLLDDRGALVTTLLDFYGLKRAKDYPGMDSLPNGSSVVRVEHVERAIWVDIGSPKNFLPFLALHEYEAWLFADTDVLPQLVEGTPEANAEFTAICGSYSPEDINESEETAPSKRIFKLFPAYRKTVHGPLAAQKIGLAKIRAVCPHFDGWLKRLEAFN